MTTIHADDSSWAIEQHALLATSASSLHREDVIGYANKVIDVIVQLERQHGTRSIREILWRDARRS